MGVNGQKWNFQVNGGRWWNNGVETAWNSFFSVCIIAIASSNNIFVNKSGGGVKAQMGVNGQKLGPPTPAICLKIQFLAIYPYLRLLMGYPLTPPPLLLTKMLLLDAIAIIHTEKKLFQAVSTPLSRHLLPFAWKFHFWPFTPICACIWATPWPHLHFYWQKCYYLKLYQ